MTEDQMYDAAEREMDLYRAEIDRITAERDDYAARLKAVDQSWAQVAAARDEYRDNAVLHVRERDEAREVLTEVLAAFGPSGSGHTARVGQVQIAKWRTRAGLTS